MHETEPLPRRFSSSPMNVLIYKAWQEQKSLGWSQIFRGRLSAKWGQAQNLYYQDNPATQGATYYSTQLWAKQVIGQLIETSLDLWVARNKVLHGTTLVEQQQIQRIRTIQVVTKKYKEGINQVKQSFPRLYMEPCNLLCDRTTLQLLKWIETFNICWGSLRREDTKRRRGYIAAIKKAYKRKSSMSKYGQITMFTEHRSILCRKETGHLKRWVEKYVQLASRGSSQADNDPVMEELEEDIKYIRGGR